MGIKAEGGHSKRISPKAYGTQPVNGELWGTVLRGVRRVEAQGGQQSAVLSRVKSGAGKREDRRECANSIRVMPKARMEKDGGHCYTPQIEWFRNTVVLYIFKEE